MKYRIHKRQNISLYKEQVDKLSLIANNRQSDYIRELINLDDEIYKQFM